MKKTIISIFSLLLLFVTLTSCNTTNKNKITTSEDSDANLEMGDLVADLPDSEIVYPENVEFNPDTAMYGFTTEEVDAYNSFAKSLDRKDFTGLDAHSVFKIFVQYGVDGAWYQEFKMLDEDSLPNTYNEQKAYNLYVFLKAQEDAGESGKKFQSEALFGDIGTAAVDDAGEKIYINGYTPDGISITVFVNRDKDGTFKIPFNCYAYPEEQE